MPITPFVVGQWVRGDRFYGHRALIEEILRGNRDCLWMLGTRRIGKTSILKELERLTSDPSANYFPLFWDFQGSEEPRDLHEGLSDALLDATDRLDTLGIALEDIEDDDLFATINRARRAVTRRGKKLLLLGDEAEELVTIHERSPKFLARLRRALQSSEGIRTVLASTIRLWRLANQDTSTSPFLHGFTPALAVRRLADDEARALIRQDQLPKEARPRMEETTVDIIRQRCNNHPYLMQLLGERYLELVDLEQAIEAVATDQMVGFFFNSDLAMLDDSERRILHALAEREEGETSEGVARQLSLRPAPTQGGLHRLEVLGFVQRGQNEEFSLVNYFFRRWLREAETTPTLFTAPPSSGRVVVAERPMLDGRYDLLERIGSGSTGEVYKARDSMLETVVAIKLLRREYSIEEDALERLRREVVLARDLSHPNLLKTYHLGHDNGQHYVTMQFIDGPDLAQVLAREAPLEVERTLDLAIKLTSALEALHRCEVLHRDIKPSNVLIDLAGEPFISDFGLARLPWSPGVTRDGRFIGTPAYSSPEQALGQDLDPRSDLYALGAVLFEMSTGRRPFVADSQRGLLEMHVRMPVPQPSEIAPAVPPAMSRLILRCLAKAPAARFQSAHELGGALAVLRSGMPQREDNEPATFD